MSDDTGIEWTDATWPITVGCTRTAPAGSVQSGCGDASGGGCYAEQSVARVNRCQVGAGRPAPYADLVKLVKRGDRTVARWTGHAKFFPERLAMPLRWKRPRRIFVSSQSDLFHDDLTNEQIAAVFGVMAAAPHHTFQVLTKRARRMREWFEWAAGEFADRQRDIACAPHTFRSMLSAALEFLGPPNKPALDIAWHAHDRDAWPLPNVWLGVSTENQAAADERIPELLATPAAVRWISAEPLLGPIYLGGDDWRGSRFVPRLNWIVAGCESGHGARPCDVAWLRSLRDQCSSTNVPFFLKQAIATPGVGVLAPSSAPPEIITAVSPTERARFTDAITAGPGSHRKAGGLIGLPYLDGVQHAAMPGGAP